MTRVGDAVPPAHAVARIGACAGGSAGPFRGLEELVVVPRGRVG